MDPTPHAPGCATLSRLLGESPAGSATPIRSWLLIEHPGPWSAGVLERVLADLLPTARRRELNALWRSAGLRTLLVRRPGRQRRGDDRRTVLLGSSRADGGRWLERLDLADVRAVADLDPVAIAEGNGGIGEPVPGPLFGVCTHGAKDVCCATHGRPVAAALARVAPGRVWETTHLGGDRFAGNVLVLPDGFLYGHVGPTTAAAVAAAADAGRVLPDLLRGRTGEHPRAQVAEIAVRRLYDLHGIDDVRPIGDDPDGAVRLRAGDREVRVRLGRHPLGAGGTSRCAGDSHPCGYALESVEDVTRYPLAAVC